MSGTCSYVQTQVRVLAEPSSTTVSPKQLVKRFSFSSVSWPFLPQATPCSSPKETCSGTLLRQRRLVPASAVAAASLAAASLSTTLTPQPGSVQSKVLSAASDLISSLPSWPGVALILLHSLRSSLARSLLDIAVRTALVLLVLEGAVVLGSLLLAAKVPPGLLFMVAAVLFLGVIAAQAISHDSAAIRRRKSSQNLMMRR
ncbi:hypothetical protein B566_EDAN001972 [Ephemera danica]|nr:hypothetical protein B566_EDAN001972 [Ephemera danica]